MKILQVIDTLNIGGAERMLVTLANLQKRNGLEVGVVILVEDGDLVQDLDDGIPIFRLERKKRFEKGKMKRFSEILKNFDIVHTHLKHNYRYTSLTMKCFFIRTPKLVFHDHSHTLRNSKASLKSIKDGLFKNVLRPPFYIGVSEENCGWAHLSLGMKKECCFLLENVIEKTQVKNENEEREGIVIVSNVSPIKNLRFAIELIHQLNEDLTIYGRIIDAVYFAELVELIERLQLEENVKWVHDCHAIQKEVHKFKFALHTSLKETGPLVLIEYLAQSLPFVSTSTGQVFQMIGKELPEFFIDSDSLEDWKIKIQGLQDVETNRIEQTYRTHFDIKIYYKKCLGIYQDILNF